MRRRLHVPTVAFALGLGLALSGCGSTGSGSKDSAAQGGVQKCREQWSSLAKVVEGRDEATAPSALPERWNTVLATIGYYAASASAKDCGDALDRQQASIVQLQDFGASLHSWDMPWQQQSVADRVKEYLATPLPRQATPRKGAKAPRAPSQAKVGSAFLTLTKEAPASVTELAPGWRQVDQVEISDKAAVARARADLGVLARQGPHFQACRRALALIQRAIEAQRAAR